MKQIIWYNTPDSLVHLDAWHSYCKILLINLDLVDQIEFPLSAFKYEPSWQVRQHTPEDPISSDFEKSI